MTSQHRIWLHSLCKVGVSVATQGSPSSERADPETAAAPVVRIGRGRLAVELCWHEQGRDVVVTITGGAAHVGAVAVVSPQGGTAGEACRDAIVVPGHKEGPLALRAAERMAAVTGKTVVAVAGIHQDGATRHEIDAIVANVAAGVERLARLWSAIPRRADDDRSDRSAADHSPAKDEP